ncbi:hypothetical protein LC612_01485 [Nostoc sp. CHAB 5834]|nr:hypothetical protein [Nostoc sp. CHAB 5834]
MVLSILIIRCNPLHLAVIVRSLPQKTFAKGNFTYAHLLNKIANLIVGNRFWQAFHLDLHAGNFGKHLICVKIKTKYILFKYFCCYIMVTIVETEE